MNDNTDTDETSGDDTPATAGRTEAATDDGLLGRLGARQRLMWGAIAFLALLGALATFRIYTNVSRVISTFVAHDFVPIFQAAFNVAVLLLAVAGIAALYTRMESG